MHPLHLCLLLARFFHFLFTGCFLIIYFSDYLAAGTPFKLLIITWLLHRLSFSLTCCFFVSRVIKANKTLLCNFLPTVFPVDEPVLLVQVSLYQFSSGIFSFYEWRSLCRASLKKHSTFHDAITGFPAKWGLRNDWWRITNQIWVVFLIGRRCRVENSLQPIRSSVGSNPSSVWNFFSRFSDVFCRGINVSVTKCRLFSMVPLTHFLPHFLVEPQLSLSRENNEDERFCSAFTVV